MRMGGNRFCRRIVAPCYRAIIAFPFHRTADADICGQVQLRSEKHPELWRLRDSARLAMTGAGTPRLVTLTKIDSMTASLSQSGSERVSRQMMSKRYECVY